MALPNKVDSLDAIPEAAREYYVKDDGGYAFDGKKAAAEIMEVLKAERDAHDATRRAANRTLAPIVKRLKLTGPVRPEVIENLAAERERLREEFAAVEAGSAERRADAIAQERLAAATAERDRVQAERDAFAAENAAFRAEADALEHRAALGRAIRSAAGRLGLADGAAEDALELAQREGVAPEAVASWLGKLAADRPHWRAAPRKRWSLFS